MARLKKGLDFFYFDISFYDDIKIRKLIRYHGAQSVVVYQLILVRIYSEGYYLVWDDDLPFIVAEVSHLQDDYVKTVIDYCIEVGLFDKQLFESDKILTSKGIQSRFFDFCVVSKRKIVADSPYLLIDLSTKALRVSKVRNHSESDLFDNTIVPNNSEQSGENSEQLTDVEVIIPNNSKNKGESSEFGTQSKVKYNNGSSFHSEPSSPQAATHGDDGVIDYLAFMEFFNGAMEGRQIPTITQLQQSRRGQLNARMREHGKEALRTVVLKAADSTFLNGGGEKSFIASFDWIFRPSNFTKILEGNFDNKNVQTIKPVNYATDSSRGYRSREDMLRGTVQVMSELINEGGQPKKSLPVV